MACCHEKSATGSHLLCPSQTARKGRKKEGRKEEEGRRGGRGDRPSVPIPASSLLLTIQAKESWFFIQRKSVKSRVILPGLAMTMVPRRMPSVTSALPPQLHPTFCRKTEHPLLYHHHRRLAPLSNTTAEARRHLWWFEINEEPPNFIKKYLFVRVRRWKRYPGRHSQMSMNAAVGCILPTFLKLGPCGLWSRLPHHGHPPVTMCWVCWASSWAGYNPLSTTTSTYPWKQDVLPLRGLLVPNCLPTTPKQRTSLTSPDVPSAQWLPSHLKCHCVCYTVVFPLPPQNVKLLKGSSGTRASLWHSQDFFLLTWSWGCSACLPWKLINNTRAFFAPIPWSIISLWPTVPGNFHIFNNHKYATPSIYFEQKKKKSNKS